jgi:predicted site-specific integrase-resolvase
MPGVVGGSAPDLDRQVARVTEWATGQRLSVDRVVSEVGSALNGKRGKFLALLRDQSVATIVVEHRDRFARFGAECVEAALAANGRRLLVVDPAGVDDDLVRDVTEILTSSHGTRRRTTVARGGLNAARKRSIPAWTSSPAR